MADSDDEFDRRNAREKFRPERNDYERRDERRPRDPWEDREWAGRGRDKRDMRRDRFSPPHDGSPPRMKRLRRDWDDGGFAHYDVPFGALPAPPVAVPPPPPPGWAGSGDMAPAGFTGASGSQRGQTSDNELQTQPPMLTFKQFMNSQDDHISDVEAVRKFSDYKTDFQKQQINEFFLQHKEEEWFRLKYYPEEYGKRLEETRTGLVSRSRVFTKLLEMNRVSSVSVDVEHNENIVKLLDAAVILMEGGTEFDLKVLERDEADNGHGESTSAPNHKPDEKNHSVIKSDHKLSNSSVDEEKKTAPKFTEPLKLEAESNDNVVTEVSASEAEPKTVAPKKEKKQRHRSGGSGGDSETGSLSDSEDETDKSKSNGKESEAIALGVAGHVETSTTNTVIIAYTEFLKSTPSSPTRVEINFSINAFGNNVLFNCTDVDKDDDGLEEGEERDEPKPRALHRTLSIFLRNLPSAVTKQEVEEVCKRYPGFIRVFVQDPQPERRFLRRGWVTFDHTVNVKEICWNLNSIRIRDCEVGAIVNRELKQRIRPVNGLTVHRLVAKQDIRHVARVIHVLDSRWNIWGSREDEKKDDEKETYSFTSQNPVLKGIAEYLVDEGSFEEQALLGEEVPEEKPKDTTPEVVIERDDNLLKVLDKMVLYLRIVYSLDYYSAIEYPNEDEMPHRCGIMHARGPLPPGRITPSDVDEWISNFQRRIVPFIEAKLYLTETEMTRLGKKHSNDEVEKFILANTQELSKDKWLCPLSGKKFKGPDFVRKHLLTKHMEKIDEVKKEVEYFNNFLKDLRRPQLPEHPTSKPLSSSGSNPLPAPAAAARDIYLPPPVGSFHGPLPPPPPAIGYRPPGMYQGGPGPFQGRGGSDPFRGNDFRRERFPGRRDNSGPRGGDQRRTVNYRDLDAPPDVDPPS